ncbi:hypothetical protein [Azospirillum sp. TSO35-2]|uniref:hypothetical protein n=1 Tax=Azospirillum sp. TSO35-2 TaxID=716796 RepID=UPI000D608B6C|nr:hypothetical protein [Azospirillum sp. TSO35-2]PWC36162.1 hypothetical protein TSO352_13530 [Azospirillum sp. TSO35-2]
MSFATVPDASAAPGASIVLTQEPGSQIGVLCRFLDPDERPIPPEADTLCVAAGDLVARKVAGHGRAVVRLGLRAVASPDAEPSEEALPPIDGPILLVVMEGRPDWTGTAHPRLLLRARPVRNGMAAPSVGLPPVSVDLAGDGWQGRADTALERVIGFALRDG